jgi:hypothetical protein
MAQQGNLGLATVRVGGREYPQVSERTCKTCSSQYRDLIEQATVGGRTWKKIIRSLPAEAGLSERNLADHFRHGHLPVAAEATQLLAERQAEERGAVVETGAARIVDFLEFAQAVMGRVNHRVAAGEVEPGISDGLRAADLLARYDPGPTMSEADYAEVFSIYADTAKAVMTSEQHQEFVARLDTNQALQDLANRWQEIHAQRPAD